MTHGLAIPPEVQQLQEALRSAIQKSPVSHSQIEQELDLPAGQLNAIFSGEAQLGVAQLFSIVRLIDVDLWQVLLPTAALERLRGDSLRS